MNLLISSLPEFVLRAKRFKFHEHIELMIKEITQESVLWSHLGKVLNFSEKKDHILCFKAIVRGYCEANDHYSSSRLFSRAC